MANVRVTYNEAELDTLLKGPGGAVVVDLTRRALLVEDRAKVLCPVRTGRLRASISHELRRDRGLPVMRIGTNVKYATYVHEGTGVWGPKHRPIRPVRSHFLRFMARDGSLVFARQVAGVLPRPFLEDALDAARG